MLKKANISVPVLVILTVLLFAFSLLAFTFVKGSIFREMGKDVSFVESFNLNDRARQFLGQEPLAKKSKFEKTGILGMLGEEVLKIEVVKIAK